MGAPRSPRGRARETHERLKDEYPDAECALTHDSPYQLLVATILSAQCTDKRVNMVTPALFARYRAPEDLAACNPTELEEIIHSTGLLPSQGPQPHRHGRSAGALPRRGGTRLHA